MGMESGTFFKKKENEIIALITGILLFSAVGLCATFSFGLNDDVLLRDIVSGAYAGSKDAHMIYSNYPLSLILKGLYLLLPMIPWWGTLLTFSVILCFELLLLRVLKFCSTRITKIFAVLIQSELFLVLFLQQYVSIHYTIVSALLGATGLFLFVTSETKDKRKDIVKENTGVILLFFMSYMIRTNVFFMELPFLAMAGLFRILMEEKIGKALLKYLPLLGLLAFGVGAFMVWNSWGYSDPEWKSFLAYNENRTTLYDYTDIPEYESATEIYQELNITREEVSLLKSYNILLDASMDGEKLQQLAMKVRAEKEKQASFKETLKKAGIEYIYRTFNELDRPYNVAVILIYIILFLQLFGTGKWKQILCLFITGITRTALWLYLLMQGRYPERITISLYLIEIMLLLGVLLYNAKMRQLLVGLLALLLLPGTVKSTSQGLAVARQQMNKNAAFNILIDYCNEKRENTYLLDVYSSVAYSDFVFERTQKEADNYILLGGWIAGSPLLKEKLDAKHCSNLEEELLFNKQVYLIIEKEKPINWLLDYYKGKGMEVTAREVDVVTASKEDTFCVYQVFEDEK